MHLSMMPRLLFRGLLLIIAMCSATVGVADNDTKEYRLHYTVELKPQTKSAHVVVEIDRSDLLRELDFNLDPTVHNGVQANGSLEIKDGRALWKPPAKNARLTLHARIPHERDPGEYDAWMTDDWAIFRGDDLVPPARVVSATGARARATLEFVLPAQWPSVNTGWRHGEEHCHTCFAIDDPERRFDRPTGWMIAGKLGTRRDNLEGTGIAVSAPKGSSLRRMDVLTFLNVVWPQVQHAFGTLPDKLLIVGHGMPMWRGGLSASNSLFLHADRPLVSENGTSALVHELVHMVTGLSAEKNADWIVEGLAEFYSFELLYRAGAMTDARRGRVLNELAEWGEEVETLEKRHSTGATTARAVLLIERLDKEIRARTDGAHSIDDVARALMEEGKITSEDLQSEAEAIVGGKLKALQSPLLKVSDEK